MSYWENKDVKEGIVVGLRSGLFGSCVHNKLDQLGALLRSREKQIRKMEK